MRCPKCDAPRTQDSISCPRCGIVFEKYFRYHPPEGAAVAPAPAPRPRVRGGSPSPLGALLFPEPGPQATIPFWGRVAIFVLIFVWGWWLMLSSVSGGAAMASVLHLVNLPFHEAGHVLFRPFGEFITSLGGTLGQLLMPAICCGALLVQNRDAFGAAVALWWLGENFLDIAPYINDARAGELPLLGGNHGHSSPYGFHDWEYLLTETGLLHLDHRLAVASHLMGCLIMILALVWAGLLLARDQGRGAGDRVGAP